MMDDSPLPFNTTKAYYEIIPGSQTKIKRNWLSYSHEHNSLFCSICLVYCSKSSAFTSDSGFSRWIHVYERIKDHEESKNHREASKCFMADQCGKSVDELIERVQWVQRENEVMKRRRVAQIIIDIVKVIGKQGLPFRGFRYESAYDLKNISVNHGNFLEIVLLIAKSNVELSDHITKAIVESEKKLKRGKSGRGNLFTFLSHKTVTNVIQTIGELLLSKISKEVNVANNYSITMDTTMDVSTHDQCVIVLRYLKENVENEKSSVEIKERVIALKKVISSSGQDAFDGAANMNGEYNGVQAKLKELLPRHIHTWCYAHVLNLVLQQTTSKSYKRLNVYECQSNSGRQSHLINISVTR
ncbi:uncharacterized protein LOC126908980 [Daktulosphaira vitifoliae]|uniref:uncharacterized protein LOC126908980 n=1 Tax=Daktulosphaira vitifoliae TaxID=58002 RepID=UPI0021AA0C79|nr:uncharacterized protein LOC126908980 [Daktulosphaira vitifoliae]